MAEKRTYSSKYIAKRFYVSAINFFDSCKILKEYVIKNDNPSIIYPLIYLERHTLELLLKSLILSEIKKQTIINGLEVDMLGKRFDLSRTHSLDILLDNYCNVQLESRIVPIFDERIKTFKDVIIKYDSYDRNGEFYKYPLTKTGKLTPNKLWNESDSSISNEIGKKDSYFIFDFDSLPTTIKQVYNVDKKAIFFKEQFFDMILYFIDLSPFKRVWVSMHYILTRLKQNLSSWL